MKKILTEKHNDIAIVSLNNGVINAISADLLDELSEAVQFAKNEASGMVLCGGDKFFSIGLDLSSLITLEREKMSEFWKKFNQVILDLYMLPIPTVAVLSGHTIAGGNILALTCDYRFGVNDNKKIGMNEITLGIPVPYLADLLLRQTVNEQEAKAMLYTGEFITFAEAKMNGLIDTLLPMEELKAQALNQVEKLAKLPKHAFAAIKANRTRALQERYEIRQNEDHEIFLDCWFSKNTQQQLVEASKQF